MHEIVQTIVKLAASVLVPLLSLDVGLWVRAGELRQELANPVLWRILLVALVGVPALAILVATLLPLGPVARGVIVLMAVSPGAPLLILKGRTQGQLSLAVAVTVALTLAAVVTLPVELLILNGLFPLKLHASVSALVSHILPKLLVPLVLGAALRRIWPKGADVLAPVVHVLFYVALALVAIAALAATWTELEHLTPWVWLAMLLVTLGAAALGDFVGGREPHERATAAYAVVLGNPAVALQVAALSYPTLKLAPVILAYVLLRAILVLPYAAVTRRRLRDLERPAT
jgi:BASS family bile acid:Na+ symporter